MQNPISTHVVRHGLIRRYNQFFKHKTKSLKKNMYDAMLPLQVIPILWMKNNHSAIITKLDCFVWHVKLSTIETFHKISTKITIAYCNQMFLIGSQCKSVRCEIKITIGTNCSCHTKRAFVAYTSDIQLFQFNVTCWFPVQIFSQWNENHNRNILFKDSGG